MDQKTVLGYGLWLFACERFCRLLEITDNGFEHGGSILNYNRCIVIFIIPKQFPAGLH